MPRVILYILLLLVALSLIPMGIVYKSRHTGKSQTRIQVVYDMDDQFSYKPQSVNPFFDDGLAARKQPTGTVARGMLREDDVFQTGSVNADTVFVETIPVALTPAMLARGRERFNIFCAPCHGTSGNGSGPVHLKAMALAEGTWTPPTDLAGETVVERPAGFIYDTIKNGVRNMPAYGSQIDVADRWAVVAYVRALQLSRNATLDDLSVGGRAALEAERQQAREAAAAPVAEPVAQPVDDAAVDDTAVEEQDTQGDSN